MTLIELVTEYSKQRREADGAWTEYVESRADLWHKRHLEHMKEADRIWFLIVEADRIWQTIEEAAAELGVLRSAQKETPSEKPLAMETTTVRNPNNGEEVTVKDFPGGLLSVRCRESFGKATAVLRREDAMILRDAINLWLASTAPQGD